MLALWTRGFPCQNTGKEKVGYLTKATELY